MRNIIFLDIDGVLNCQEAYISGECKYQEWIWEDGRKDHYQRFCSWNKKWLNLLIKETNADIVISSTWRSSGLEFMRKVWNLEQMEGEIIGITPIIRANGVSIPRGIEIEYYLKNDLDFQHCFWDKEIQQFNMEKSNINNYIIIDDDGDMLYQQRNHFVHVYPPPRNFMGFNEEHYLKALNILSKSVIDINYD